MSDWVPFLVNTARVRKWLDYSCSSAFLLSREPLNDIAISRPATPIFPNLSEILIGTRELEPFYMGSSVRCLDLVVDNVSVSRTTWVLRNVADCLPDLTELTISYLDRDTPNYDDPIVDLLRNLSKLRQVTLPILCLNAAIACTLARHQDLRAIRFDVGAPIAFYTCSQETRFLFNPTHPLPSGGFPSLRLLEFSAPNLNDAASFLFQSESPLSNLKQLSVHTRVVPSSEDIDQFIARLATDCPGLHDLTLAFHALKYRNGAQLSHIPHLELQHILPASRIKDLASLVIRHPHPIDMNDDDVGNLAADCPRLRTLHLNPYPIVTTRPTTSLLALKHLADHCPTLTSVGLYIDGTLPPQPIPMLSRRLRVSLALGHSPLFMSDDASVKDYPMIVQYLASVLSNSCVWHWQDDVFVAQVSNRKAWLPEMTVYHDLDGYERGWKVVAAMTKMLLEDRDRMQTSGSASSGEGQVDCERKYATLEAENAELRAKYEAVLRKES